MPTWRWTKPKPAKPIEGTEEKLVKETPEEIVVQETKEPSGPPVYNIGIWGGRSSGKTHYILAFWHDAGKVKWKVIPDSEPTYLETIEKRDSANDKNAEAPTINRQISTLLRMQEAQHTFYTMGKFETETTYLFPYRFITEIPLPRSQSKLKSELICPDGPGEYFKRFDPIVMRHLTPCRGVLVILDPEKLIEEASIKGKIADNSGETEDAFRETTFYQVTELLKNLFPIRDKDREKRYVAFCFSKIDSLKMVDSFNDLWRYKDSPNELAQKLLSMDTFNYIKQVIPEGNYSFWCFSAVGRLAGSYTNIKVDNKARPSGIIYPGEKIQSVGIYQPMAWLLNKIRLSAVRSSDSIDLA